MSAKIDGHPPPPPPPTTGATGAPAPKPAAHDPRNPTSLRMRDSFEKAPKPLDLFPATTLGKVAQQTPLQQMRGYLTTLQHASTKQDAAEGFRNLVGFLNNLPADQRAQVLSDPGVRQQLAALVGDAKSPAGKLLSGIADGPLGDLARSVQRGPIGDVAGVIGNVVEVLQAVKPDVSVDTANRDVSVRGVTIDVDKAREVLKKHGIL